MRRPWLSIIIPCYNEERRILKTLNELSNYTDSVDYAIEVRLLDDGSTDTTAKIIKGFVKEHSHFYYHKLLHQGKAAAVIAGVKKAKGELILYTDVDLAVPLTELERFFLWIDEQGFDVVIASREGVGARRVGEPYIRHLMGRIFNLFVQALLLPGISDTQCGFKLFRVAAAKKTFSHLNLYGKTSPVIKTPRVTAFDVEVLYLARQLGLRIKEIPVTWHYGSESKVHRIRDSVYNLADVFKVRWYALRGAYRL